MRAIAANRYGDNNVLNVADVEDPRLGPDTIIVRTRAAGLNPVDWKVLRGYLDGAFPVHFPLVPCWDVAGSVPAGRRGAAPLLAAQRGVRRRRRAPHLQWTPAADGPSPPRLGP